MESPSPCFQQVLLWVSVQCRHGTSGKESSPVWWLQSSTKVQGRDGYRDAAANHLMSRLAENNLASSPSWLVLLACSPLLLLCLLTGTHCLYYWCSTFSMLLAEANFRCERTSGSTSIHPHSFQEPVSFSMALVGSPLQGTKTVSDPVAVGLRDELMPLQSQDALAAILHHALLSLAPLKRAARGGTDANALCMPHFVVAIKYKKSEIDLLIMDVLLTETHPTCTWHWQVVYGLFAV